MGQTHGEQHKHMDSSTNAQWELNQGSNKALSALSWPITHRGVRPRKQKFLPVLIIQHRRAGKTTALLLQGLLFPFPDSREVEGH